VLTKQDIVIRNWFDLVVEAGTGEAEQLSLAGERNSGMLVIN